MSLSLVEFIQDNHGLVHGESDTFTCGGSSCNVLAVPSLLCAVCMWSGVWLGYVCSMQK